MTAAVSGCLDLLYRRYSERGELDPVRLRIMTISLLNSEKLSLNWSSNVGSSKAVSYVITFYKKEDNSTLFSLTMSPYDMTTEGWTGESGESGELAVLTLKDSVEKDKGNWCFPELTAITNILWYWMP